MQPTIWLENSEGIRFNLRPRDNQAAGGAFFEAVVGTGFETKLTVTRVKDDFLTTERTPQQVALAGKIYFSSSEKKEQFARSFCVHGKTVKFCYDPTGSIVYPPNSQAKPWYKEVEITKFEDHEEDANTSCFVCNLTLTPTSALWRRDVTVSAEAELTAGSAHVYDYTYPYVYNEDNRLHVVLNNTGDRTGCKIEVENASGSTVPSVAWSVSSSSGDVLQHARWMVVSGLATNRTLIVDSDSSRQKAVVVYAAQESDVTDEQEASPQYVNFVELLPGENDIVFVVDASSGVSVRVSYAEQKRCL